MNETKFVAAEVKEPGVGVGDVGGLAGGCVGVSA